jgi:RNA polymerase sigma-70 factor (ECF subfamily)
LRQQEETEFTAFVERNSRFVFRVAYAMLRNAHDAEDVMQETFLKLWRKNAWQQLDSERGFLARAAWRTAADRVDAMRLRSREEDQIFDLPSSAPNPEQSALTANWTAVIHQLIDALPEELRRPLALSSVGEMNSRDIAIVLSIPEGTARTRLMRARQLLWEKLFALQKTPQEESRYAPAKR